MLIIGGTGFLGYHATLELLTRGHEVTVVGLPPAPPSGYSRRKWKFTCATCWL